MHYFTGFQHALNLTQDPYIEYDTHEQTLLLSCSVNTVDLHRSETCPTLI